LRAGKPGVVPVTGVVTLDGKPVENAAVMLMAMDLTKSVGPPASAATDKEGRFTLKTENIGPGAVPGKYQVTVIKKETTGVLADKHGLAGRIAPGGVKEKWLVPQKYASPTTSGWTAIEVKAGMEPLKLDLKSR
jgi:hypothetical protein